MTQIPEDVTALSLYLGTHIDAEQEALDAYARLVEEHRDDVVGYLVGMILEDERRHHEAFLAMRNSLESSIRWQSVEPRLPSTRVGPEDVAELLATTDRLLELEKEDARELRRLRKQWSDLEGARQLWTMLVRIAELDTEKHITILRYLQEVLADAGRGR